YNPGVMFDGVGSGHSVYQGRDISRTAYLLEFARAPKLVCKRDEVDRHDALRKRDHLRVYSAMGVQEEFVAAQQFNGLIAERVIQQDGPEYRALRFHARREAFLDKGIAGGSSRHIVGSWNS